VLATELFDRQHGTPTANLWVRFTTDKSAGVNGT